MKKSEWINGNKMRFESSHKTFNDQTNIISTGNIIANTQYGSYVRPYTETECNGFTNEEGHLQDFDLEPFIRNFQTSSSTIKEIKTICRFRTAILYAFFHRNREGKRIVHGYILTSAPSNTAKTLMLFLERSSTKSLDILHEAGKYISNGRDKQ